MKATIILSHPYDKSFNHAIYKQAINTLKEKGVTTYKHDLYADGFDPVLTCEELGKAPTTDPLVLRYTEELMASDLLIFIHPNWWGMPPAILKGYIDRVIRPPHAYDFPEGASGGGLPIGKLAGKKALVFNTSNTDADREDNYFNDPLENIWIRCVFGFCGIEEDACARKMFRIVADSSLDEREGWLGEVDAMVGEWSL